MVKLFPENSSSPFLLAAKDSFLFRRPQTRFSMRIKLPYP